MSHSKCIAGQRVNRSAVRIPVFLLLALLLNAFSACRQQAERPSETGLASFYSTTFEGRTTASGTKFSNSKFTAAHRSLSFGTQVKVTNLENNKSVVVTITDRGPFIGDRIIDLSGAAAAALDFIDRGVVEVRLEVVSEE